MEDMMHFVDHTVLKMTATWEEVNKLCEEAIKYHTASVCIPPCYVERVKKTFGSRINICTVIGFPLGYNTSKVKVLEAVEAVEKGASEIDMVINLTDVKSGNYSKVSEEIGAIKKAIGNKILKVIIETCYLTEDEKVAMCKAVTEAGADYIKTSTGFGSSGAQLEDIELFRRHIGETVKIKAAGGIRSPEALEQFIKAGCSRVGTSAAVSFIKEET